jgi:hypothetical protein
MPGAWHESHIRESCDDVSNGRERQGSHVVHYRLYQAESYLVPSRVVAFMRPCGKQRTVDLRQMCLM